MPALSSETIQAACVAVDGRGVLIEARDGDARSDLALRMIDRGAMLVADAQTVCTRQDRSLSASAPAGAAGRMDVRGLGTIDMPCADRVAVALAVVLLESGPRFPEDRRTRTIAGVEVPVLALAALDPAAPIKAELWLKQNR